MLKERTRFHKSLPGIARVVRGSFPLCYRWRTEHIQRLVAHGRFRIYAEGGYQETVLAPIARLGRKLQTSHDPTWTATG